MYLTASSEFNLKSIEIETKCSDDPSLCPCPDDSLCPKSMSHAAFSCLLLFFMLLCPQLLLLKLGPTVLEALLGVWCLVLWSWWLLLLCWSSLQSCCKLFIVIGYF